MLVRGKFTSTPSVALALALAATGCGTSGKGHKAPKVTAENVVTNEDPSVKISIGNETSQFEVLGPKAMEHDVAKKTILSAESAEGAKALVTVANDGAIAATKVKALESDVAGTSASPAADAAAPAAEARAEAEPSLSIGFPVKLFNEGQIFGGVITKVSDSTSETLGRLKLIELESLHVRPNIARDGSGKFFLILNGCARNCGELSPQQQLIGFPISGVSADQTMVYLDTAAIGKDLSLIGMIDPNGDFTGLQEKFSKTTFADFSSSTLVFDIESHMIPIGSDPADPSVKETVITARWYLKLESGMNSAFEIRTPTKGVGFFGTSRNAKEKIMRHSLTQFDGDEAPVFYYIKNVPSKLKDVFSTSFDHWNEAMREVMDRDILGYEHVTDDAMNKLLVAGDVRFNILEWDLENIAPYGGLGPSIASQNTGEIFSANVLVQGPTILKLYSDWFKVQDEVTELRAAGNDAEAEAKLVAFKRMIDAKNAAVKALPKVEARLGKLVMSVPAQNPNLEDPAMARMDFYDTPEGLTYDQYMHGYWQDIVTHELGHNIGLRHNFRGNLFASGDTAEAARPSGSVMEYLSRPYRHKNRVGEYDKMAIGYAYAGKEVTRLDMFCTDEDVPSAEDVSLSAECSRDDATADPFNMLLGHLKRGIDLGVGRGSPVAPFWTVADLKSEVEKAAVGLGYYASSATNFAGSWTNFKKGERPAEADKVAAYVAGAIKGKLCDPSVDTVIRGKATEEAKQAATANLKGLRDLVSAAVAPMGLADALKCN